MCKFRVKSGTQKAHGPKVTKHCLYIHLTIVYLHLPSIICVRVFFVFLLLYFFPLSSSNFTCSICISYMQVRGLRASPQPSISSVFFLSVLVDSCWILCVPGLRWLLFFSSSSFLLYSVHAHLSPNRKKKPCTTTTFDSSMLFSTFSPSTSSCCSVWAMFHHQAPFSTVH